jgi:UDP-N-acetylglucosamine--N-acetylmuramyl-(pentapeptide) pyrophosphoryl-undecaprenol N-acetylglucosamine transferase
MPANSAATNQSLRVIFAGGGTAGHIEPALATARRWIAEHPTSEISFLGTEHGLETTLIPAAGFPLQLIPKVRVPRALTPALLKLPFSLISSVTQSIRIIRGADVLVGFGGYVSGPAYLAALISRVPIVIHEANARPGIANRLGALFTQYLAVAHPIHKGRLSTALIAGLPLREDVSRSYAHASNDWGTSRKSAKKSLGFDSERPLVFIFGGSQGSLAINEVISQARKEITDAGVQILHGVGARNSVPESTKDYMAVSYISDMATAYLAADLIISRSGAVTCAEVNTLGRYALFIPLPVGNGEQELNAAELIEAGRAELVAQRDFTASWLRTHLHRLLQASMSAPVEGSRIDIDAASKMVALMDQAIARTGIRG